MRLYFEIAGNQIDGARDYQEDAFLNSYLDVGEDPKGAAVVIMADGMGGHAAGNIASNLVVSTFNKTFGAGFGNDEIPSLLRIALAKANGALSESIRETPALDGMGCTMVSGVFHEGKVWWVSVGDSHLYLIRDRELGKQNEDHSYGGYLDRMAQQGMEIEPEPGLSRNMLMSAMTGDDIAEVDCPNSSVQLLPGDRLVVASDGLDTLSAGTIVQMSAWSNTPKECVDALLKAVEDEGKPRQDNTTVIVVDVLDRDAAGAPVPPPSGRPAEAPSAPGLDDTQPLDLSEIKNALAKETPADAPVVEMAFNDDDDDEDEDEDDDEGGSAGRIIAIVLLLLVLVGAAGAGIWYYLQQEAGGPDSPTPVAGGEETPTPTPTTGTGETPAPTPVPVPTPTPTPVATGGASGGGGEMPVVAQPTQPVQPTQPPPAQIQAGSTAEIRDPLSSGGEGPILVVVPSGTFQMGTNFLAHPDQSPKHTVGILDLAIGKFEVSQGEYQRYSKATGAEMPKQEKAGDDYPVVNMSWNDAVKYTEWLSEQTGLSYRLLSESEWEYAASAGNELPFWWGYSVEPGRAHCITCGSDFTSRSPTRVGRFDPNPFGLHDTAGNVLEWVQDCYNNNYSGAPTDGSAWIEDGDCGRRVARGGAYNSPGDSLKSQNRNAFDRKRGRKNIGFRVVRDL